MPPKQRGEQGSVLGAECAQSLYNGSRAKPAVPRVHTCFVRGMVFPWGISSKFMEEGLHRCVLEPAALGTHDWASQGMARGSGPEGRDCGHRDPRPAESEL